MKHRCQRTTAYDLRAVGYKEHGSFGLDFHIPFLRDELIYIVDFFTFISANITFLTCIDTAVEISFHR